MNLNSQGASCFGGDLDVRQAGTENLGYRLFSAWPNTDRLSR
jgi:hypothetical protein